MIFVVKFLLDSCFEPIQLKMSLFLHLEQAAQPVLTQLHGTAHVLSFPSTLFI